MGNLQKTLLAKDAELCKIRQEINELKKENTVSCTCVHFEFKDIVKQLARQLLFSTHSPDLFAFHVNNSSCTSVNFMDLFLQDLRVGCEKATAALTQAEKAAEEIASVQEQLKSSVSQVHTLQTTLENKNKEITVSVFTADKTFTYVWTGMPNSLRRKMVVFFCEEYFKRQQFSHFGANWFFITSTICYGNCKGKSPNASMFLTMKLKCVSVIKHKMCWAGNASVAVVSDTRGECELGGFGCPDEPHIPAVSRQNPYPRLHRRDAGGGEVHVWRLPPRGWPGRAGCWTSRVASCTVSEGEPAASTNSCWT